MHLKAGALAVTLSFQSWSLGAGSSVCSTSMLSEYPRGAQNLWELPRRQ